MRSIKLRYSGCASPYVALCIQGAGNELIAGEALSLVGKTVDFDGFILCESIGEIRRSAFLRFGACLLAHAPTLGSLSDAIRVLKPKSEAFRIEIYDVSGAQRISSRQTMLDIAEVLEGRPNLRAPQHRFALVIRSNGYWFGEIVTETEDTWKSHETKPFRTSSSLPSRLARAIVNLAAKPGDKVLNVGCGSGSLLLEAACIGATAWGLDWNKRMVGMARANAAHFGYPIEVGLGDARSWQTRGSVVIADLPYDRNCKTTDENVLGIISHAITMAPHAVLIADRDISLWMRRAGWEQVSICRVPHPSGFTRFVHDARPNAACTRKMTGR